MAPTNTSFAFVARVRAPRRARASVRARAKLSGTAREHSARSCFQLAASSSYERRVSIIVFVLIVPVIMACPTVVVEVRAAVYRPSPSSKI